MKTYKLQRHQLYIAEMGVVLQEVKYTFVDIT